MPLLSHRIHPWKHGRRGGPYGSAAEFYADYPLALGRNLSAGHQQVATGQKELSEAFRSLATSFQPLEAEGQGTEGFGLANYDLNPNNFLVDHEFNLLAVIDWDSVIAVPDAALYRMPFLMGVACLAPGTVEAHPAVARRHLFSRRFAEVAEEVGQVEREKSTVQGTDVTYISLYEDWALCYPPYSSTLSSSSSLPVPVADFNVARTTTLGPAPFLPAKSRGFVARAQVVIILNIAFTCLGQNPMGNGGLSSFIQIGLQ